jgi:hypothetical protein
MRRPGDGYLYQEGKGEKGKRGKGKTKIDCPLLLLIK